MHQLYFPKIHDSVGMAMTRDYDY